MWLRSGELTAIRLVCVMHNVVHNLWSAVRLRNAAGLASLALLASACSTAAPSADNASLGGVETPPERTTPAFVIEDLEGKELGELDRLLGAASLVRSEGRGEFRRYAFDRCMLMIVAVPDDSGVKRVSSLYAGAKTSEDPKDVSVEECLFFGLEEEAGV